MLNFKITKPPKLNVDFKGCMYLGVPKSNAELTKGKNTPPRKEFTNADILFILERGSPAKGIVPRPLLESVIKLHREELREAILGALPLITHGNEAEVDKYFEKLALRIQGWTQMFFVREGQELWEPSMRVLRAWKKGKKAKTLIDTGSLRQSIICYYSKDGNE